jgi:hypothetical protein
MFLEECFHMDFSHLEKLTTKNMDFSKVVLSKAPLILPLKDNGLFRYKSTLAKRNCFRCYKVDVVIKLAVLYHASNRKSRANSVCIEEP